MIGIIIKGIGGLYYVKVGNGVYECKARGRFRKDEIKPMVGDRVEFEVNDKGEGFIKEILPRANCLVRPAVANIDQVIVVFSVKSPDPNLLYIDKLLVMCAFYNVETVICVNKRDLDDEGLCQYYGDIYMGAGYKVIFTSTKSGEGIDELKKVMKDKVSALAGPSGVGKSSLLNAVQPDLNLKTGDISAKANRGKHTTRHVELLQLRSGGHVLDTPGFGAIDLGFLTMKDVVKAYPEFKVYEGQCRFADCLHISEPGCAVKKALEEGKISKERHENYLDIQKEVQEAQERRYN